jgi:hypothetical protein
MLPPVDVDAWVYFRTSPPNATLEDLSSMDEAGDESAAEAEAAEAANAETGARWTGEARTAAVVICRIISFVVWPCDTVMGRV